MNQNVKEIIWAVPKGVKIAHVNLLGILNKLDQIKILLKDEIFDVFAVTESKLDFDISDSEIKIQGYTVIRRDQNRQGSGVNLYKEQMDSNEHSQKWKFLTIKIKLLNSLKINVGVANRLPDSNAQWIEGFDERLEDLSIYGTELVIMGDSIYNN